VDFNSAYQAMWGQEMQVLTPKVLAVRPNLWEWWVGEKICAMITMYCGVSIADNVDRQQSKKE
jgi:hypothetical protein